MRGSPFCVARAVARPPLKKISQARLVVKRRGSGAAARLQRQMDRIEARQASFLAAPALTRRREKMENERKQRLREAGCTDSESYLPLDWAEPVGSDVHEIPELRAVTESAAARVR